MKGPSDEEFVLIWTVLLAGCVASWWGIAGIIMHWW